jgi:hypothetical protein
MKADFSLLYSELHLPPDCSLEEFKCAYRRRIAELHPDRQGSVAPSPEAQATLPALIATYVAVNRFHSRYGRMPGASPRPVAGQGPRAASSPSRLPVPVPESDDETQSSGHTGRLVLVFVAVLLVLLATWDWVTFSP